MAWYWSDDVARAAIEAGLTSEQAVRDWIQRPVAFAADAGRELTDVAAGLLGVEVGVSAGAA